MAWSNPVFPQEDTNMANAANTETINSEAVTQAQQGNYDLAITRFKTVVSIQDQNVAATYNNLGYTFLLKKDYPNAIENFKKAIARNPVLVPSLANLGKALYETNQYKDAVFYGEKVIALNPPNAAVRVWLPDAYKKAAEKRMFELENLKDTNANTKKTDESIDPNAEALQNGKKPPSKIELAGLLETAWDHANKKLVWYGPHTTIPFPVTLSTDIWASPTIRISGEIKNPNMGVSLPYFITSEESLGIIFHSKKFFYGVGFYFSQANFTYDTVPKVGRFIQNSSFPARSDSKIGFIFGFQKEFSSFLFSIYPRQLFQDAAVGPQSIEFDRTLSKIEYRAVYPEKKGSFIPTHFELAAGLKTNEFFITEYTPATTGVTTGHYIGWYDLYIDMAFGKIKPRFDTVPMQFGLLMGSRFYFEDFNNTKPFVPGNGQGFAGIKAQLGKSGLILEPPAFKAVSLLIDVYFKQMFYSKMILMEKIGTEIPAPGQPANAFSAGLSVSYTF